MNVDSQYLIRLERIIYIYQPIYFMTISINFEIKKKSYFCVRLWFQQLRLIDPLTNFIYSRPVSNPARASRINPYNLYGLDE